MTKAELIEKIYAKGLRSKTDSEYALDAAISCLREALLAGETVTFQNFGVFKLVEHKARKGRNVRTGEEIEIPARKMVKFIPSKSMKDALN